jgi:hypothetical protein
MRTQKAHKAPECKGKLIQRKSWNFQEKGEKRFKHGAELRHNTARFRSAKKD